MAAQASPVSKNDKKKLVQPRLSNFFANAKVHVSSVVLAPECPVDENDENVPLVTSPSLTTHVEASSCLEPLKESAAASQSSVASESSISNFLKTPIIPSHQNTSKKRKLSAESCGKVVKAPKIVGPAECDPEVSSSSETVETDSPPSSATSKSSANRLTLDRFLQSTQQAEVSTTASAEPDSSKALSSEGSLDAGINESSVCSAEEERSNAVVAEGGDGRGEASLGEATDAEAGSDDVGKDAAAIGETTDLLAVDAEIGEGVEQGMVIAEEEKAADTVAPSPVNVTPKSIATKPRTLTPKQRLLQEERQKKQEERDRLKRAKEEERERIRLEKQREKDEKVKAKQAEKEKIEREKEEARKVREEEKRKKQEEQEAEKSRKEEEKKRKEAEKSEERAKKEEEKRLLEEEKSKEEQEKLVLKERQSKAFVGFFKKKEKKEEEAKLAEKAGFGIPFQIREHMVLAPLRRKAPSTVDLGALDAALTVADCEVDPPSPSKLYLGDWKTVRRAKRPLRGEKTLLPGCLPEDVPNARKAFRHFQPEAAGAVDAAPIRCKAKFFQFRENHRPAYFGTFRKKSTNLNPRNPLRKDESLFDYEVDSDDEWEEEEPGEDLEKQSDGEGDEEEEEVVEEEEDPFFVPHGYLSEDEGAETSPENSEDEDEDEDDDDDDDEGSEDEQSQFPKKERKEKAKKRMKEEKIPEDKLDPATRKAQQEVKAKAFEVERRARKITRLIPRCVGVLWASLGAEGSLEQEAYQSCNLQEGRHLASFRAVVIPPVAFPVRTNASHPKKAKPATEAAPTPSADKSALKKDFPEEAFPDFLRLLHGSTVSKRKLWREFNVFWQSKTAPPKTADEPSSTTSSSSPPSGDLASSAAFESVISQPQLYKTIKSIAEFKGGMYLVHEDVQKKYDLLGELPLPNQWTFATLNRRPKEPKDSSTTESAGVTATAPPPSKPPQRTLFHFLDKAEKSGTGTSSGPTEAEGVVRDVANRNVSRSDSLAACPIGTPSRKDDAPPSSSDGNSWSSGKAATTSSARVATPPPRKIPQRTLLHFFDKSAAAAAPTVESPDGTEEDVAPAGPLKEEVALADTPEGAESEELAEISDAAAGDVPTDEEAKGDEAVAIDVLSTAADAVIPDAKMDVV